MGTNNVEDNINLIFEVIHHKMTWMTSLYEFEDLKSEGLMGLLKATRTYNDSLNIKFSTYAYKCIFQHLMDYHRKESRHRFGRYPTKDQKKVRVRNKKFSISSVDLPELFFTLTPVQAYTVRKKYNLGV